MTRQEALTRLLELERILRPEGYKELYAERDELTLALAREGFTSEEESGYLLTLKDNFASGNCAWTAAAVRRYEIKIEDAEEAKEKAARKK